MKGMSGPTHDFYLRWAEWIPLRFRETFDSDLATLVEDERARELRRVLTEDGALARAIRDLRDLGRPV